MHLRLHWTLFAAAAVFLAIIIVAPIALPDAWPFAILIGAVCLVAFVLVFQAVAPEPHR
jgi:hypothetical protein